MLKTFLSPDLVSVKLASELVYQLCRAGFKQDSIKELCRDQGILREMLERLHKQREPGSCTWKVYDNGTYLNSTYGFIDPPELVENIDTRFGWLWDPALLELVGSECSEADMPTGEDMLNMFPRERFVGADLCNDLLRYPHLIPQQWAPSDFDKAGSHYILFPGSIYVNSEGSRGIQGFKWHYQDFKEGSWEHYYFRLNQKWDAYSRLVLHTE